MMYGDHIELVTDDMRADAMTARDKIVALQNERSALRLALSVALPVLEQHEPRLHRLIVSAVGYGPMKQEPSIEKQMTAHGIFKVIEGGRTKS